MAIAFKTLNLLVLLGRLRVDFPARLGAQTALELLLYLSVETTPFTLAFSQ